MNGLIDTVARDVPTNCQVKHCRRDSCSLMIEEHVDDFVLVNVDCSALKIPRDQYRCDYVLVAEVNHTLIVAPIELKSGHFQGDHVVLQLQAGATLANRWLPPGAAFRLVPILAHKRESIHPVDLRALREQKIALRDSDMQAVLVSCGASVHDALCKSGLITAPDLASQGATAV